METTTLSRRYSDLERQELIAQWKQSGKSKVTFCKERELSYYSFNDWIKRGNKKSIKQKSSFVPITIKNSEGSIFAQLILKNGTSVNIYKQVDVNYLTALIKV